MKVIEHELTINAIAGAATRAVKARSDPYKRKNASENFMIHSPTVALQLASVLTSRPGRQKVRRSSQKPWNLQAYAVERSEVRMKDSMRGYRALTSDVS